MHTADCVSIVPLCLTRVLIELLDSAWGDRLFTLAQTAAIVFLILHYRGDTLIGIWTAWTFALFCIFLKSHRPAKTSNVFVFYPDTPPPALLSTEARINI